MLFSNGYLKSNADCFWKNCNHLIPVRNGVHRRMQKAWHNVLPIEPQPRPDVMDSNRPRLQWPADRLFLVSKGLGRRPGPGQGAAAKEAAVPTIVLHPRIARRTARGCPACPDRLAAEAF